VQLLAHHLLQRLPDPRNTMMFIGFQAPGTRGAQIKDGEPQVKIFGQIVNVRAHVVAIEQMSDHADTPEMLEWMRTFTKRPRQTYLVHGEPAAASALRLAITSALGWKVDIAEYREKVPLG
jgi:metallo-beta-lactamase family protein